MSGALSKLAALGLLIAVVAGLWFAVSQPVAIWRAETLERLANAESEIQRLEAAKARLDARKARLSTEETDSGFWKASQSGEAYARIQGELARKASQNGIRFRAMTPLPVVDREGVESAIIRIEFEADLAQLTGFLRTIEYSVPALPVERAVLRRLVRPGDTSRFPMLFSQIDIAAPLLIAEES